MSRAHYEVVHLDEWDRLRTTLSDIRFRSWAFRGQSDATWPLLSSLSRYLFKRRIHPDAWPQQESRILRIFKRKAHLFLPNPPSEDDSFEWLSIMQHHGIPIRLLDFTWSPHVAAFFLRSKQQQIPQQYGRYFLLDCQDEEYAPLGRVRR